MPTSITRATRFPPRVSSAVSGSVFQRTLTDTLSVNDFALTSDQDPYPLYPSFDRNTVPWHLGSGAWGPQITIDAPATPTTNNNQSVSDASGFNTQAAIDGRQITVTSSISAVVEITASDIDIIIGPGVKVEAIDFGSFSLRDISRIRLRGGGRVGFIFLRDLLVTDVIVDGVDIGGCDLAGDGFRRFRGVQGDATRIAVLNSRILAGGDAWLGNCRHLFFGNTNLYAGAVSRATAGFAEGWGMRNTGGPITMVDCQFQTTRYHILRPQSYDGVGEGFFAKNCKLIGVSEGKTAWGWNNLGNTGTSAGSVEINETEGGTGVAYADISNITQANPCRITFSAPLTKFGSEHQAVVGNKLRLIDIGGMTELNYYTNGFTVYEVVGTDGSTYVDINVDSTSFTAYTSGGRVWRFPIGNGFVLEDCEVYAYSEDGGACGGADLDVSDCYYSRVRRTTFYSGGAGNIANWDQTFADAEAAQGEVGEGGRGDHDWDDSGVNANTFLTLTALPSWGGPGDPRDIPQTASEAVVAYDPATVCEAFV